MKIPQLDSNNFKLPVTVNNGTIEVGIAEPYIAEPIRAYIHKYEGQIRNTEEEKINIENLQFYFREGGFAVQGDVKVEVRKLLSQAPIIGAVYTPWMTLSGSFVEELTVDVVEGRLNVSHSQLRLSTTEGWYKKLFDDFVFPYLQNEVVKQIDEQVSNFNGMTLDELVLKYGKERLSQAFGENLLSDNRVNTFLKLANAGANRFERIKSLKKRFNSNRISARVEREYLWLSLGFAQINK